MLITAFIIPDDSISTKRLLVFLFIALFNFLAFIHESLKDIINGKT